MDLLLQYVTGNAAEHSAPAPGDIDAPADDEAEMGILARALRMADRVATPHVAEHVDVMLAGEPSQRVTWAIQALIAGIAATPTPVATHR